jgi:phage terminase large subunit
MTEILKKKLRIETAEVFEPLLSSARHEAAHGGCGSGKSYFFASHVLTKCLLKPGTSVVCIREVQRVLAQSSKKLVDDTIKARGLESQFESQVDKIKTPGGGPIIFRACRITRRNRLNPSKASTSHG